MGYEKTIKMNPEMTGQAEIFPDILFSQAGGEDLYMQIISPWWHHDLDIIPRYPALVFIQGSSWTFPNVWYEVPQLCNLAQKGYVVATITHRNALEGHPYPACIQDVNTAIRFLRANADTYAIDVDHIGLMGTSSGGNMVLLSELYRDDPAMKTEEYADFSDKVNFIVSAFPTNDFVEFYKDPDMDQEIKDIFLAISDNKLDKDMTILRKMSPYLIIKDKIEAGEKIDFPPLFLTHGTGDLLIPYNQTKKFYDLIKEKTDIDTTFVTVEEGPHEGPFWSKEIRQMIFEFIEKNI